MTPYTLLLFCLFLLFSNIVHADNPLQQAKDKIEAGYYREAEQQLQQIAATPQDAHTATLAQGLQGLLALYRQQYDSAEQILTAAMSQAQQQHSDDLTVCFALYLGQLHQQQARPVQAQRDFAQALSLAEKLPDKSILISALTNNAKLAIANQQTETAWNLLQQTKPLLTALPLTFSSTQLWLNNGYQLAQLYLAAPNETYLTAAYEFLNKALAQAREIQQPRLQAAALKHLASLYQQQQRYADAQKLLIKSTQLAQQENADDLLVELEWQLGTLYQMQKQVPEAIIAYRQALQHLEIIRLDIPVSYEKGHSSFKNTFAPLYLSLADLLLQQAPLADKNQQQVLLHEAQETLELMKKSELEDYFQNRCSIPATPLDLSKIDPHAAAIYPIQLPDRLEIIVYTAAGLRQFTQAISSEKIDQQAHLLVEQLRSSDAEFAHFKGQAEFLYQALIQPLLPLLKEQQIETLIYVPDGVLRSLPLSALYDGKQFLIEQFAIVTSPGTSLTGSDVTQHSQQDILFAGMSFPGRVVYELPDALLGDLVKSVSANLPETTPTRSLEKQQVNRYLKQWLDVDKKRELTANEIAQKTRDLHELLEKTTIAEKLQEELALPGVENEIKQLAKQNKMPYSLNENFTLANFSQSLNAHPYKMLHIASHGFFGATTEESFVMTHDKILTMNKLEELLNSAHFKKFPLDLIVLSACETAEGDDRSPLGISGIAIKAKVHSALGSLWSVSDEATAQLMGYFYEALKKPQYGKAKALQEAEIKLLKTVKNPAIWSPFILVGHWW